MMLVIFDLCFDSIFFLRVISGRNRWRGQGGSRGGMNGNRGGAANGYSNGAASSFRQMQNGWAPAGRF